MRFIAVTLWGRLHQIKKAGAAFAVRPFYLVDRPECYAHSDLLHDFIEMRITTRPRKTNKIPKRYLESNLSSQQIADEVGVSKQFVLTQLRAAGIRGFRGRGRSPDNYRFKNPPYGYRVRNGVLETHPREIKVARLIVELKERQSKDFREISENLNMRGWKTRRGTGWTDVRVRRIYNDWKGKL